MELVTSSAPPDLWELFDPETTDRGFGSRTLARFSRGDATADPSRYALAHDLKLNGTHFGRRFPERYFDATFNVCLTCDEQLVASLGFDYDRPAITVWQLQGRQGAGELLRPFAWPRALVAYAVGWARAAGLAEVQIASIEHVGWARGPGHLDPERGRLLYDATARRSGFRRGTDGYWHLPLDRVTPG